MRLTWFRRKFYSYNVETYYIADTFSLYKITSHLYLDKDFLKDALFPIWHDLISILQELQNFTSENIWTMFSSFKSHFQM